HVSPCRHWRVLAGGRSRSGDRLPDPCPPAHALCSRAGERRLALLSDVRPLVPPRPHRRRRWNYKLEVRFSERNETPTADRDTLSRTLFERHHVTGEHHAYHLARFDDDRPRPRRRPRPGGRCHQGVLQWQEPRRLGRTEPVLER